jgi:hypothetical protein
MRDACGAKHFTREIHVRQPLPYDERSTVQRGALNGNFLAYPSSEFSNFILTITSDNAGGWNGVAEVKKRQGCTIGLRTHFLDSRQPLVDSLVKTARKRCVRHHDIDTL